MSPDETMNDYHDAFNRLFNKIEEIGKDLSFVKLKVTEDISVLKTEVKQLQKDYTTLLAKNIELEREARKISETVRVQEELQQRTEALYTTIRTQGWALAVGILLSLVNLLFRVLAS